jgi:TP901 family phage tail tape measure protein
MAGGVGLFWDLLAKDNASPTFLRVAGAADKAATATQRASSSMALATARMGKVGATLTKKVTLPLAALGAVSIDQAAKYQKGLNTIAVATDQTSKQMAANSKGLLSIAKSTGTSLDQLTDALYTVEKGGLRGSKALATVKAAAQGAKAEAVPLTTATAALTSVMASYGKALGDPVRAENEIIRGAGLAKTTMADFADSLSNVVPLASSLHISFAQVAGAIDTMTQHGETAQRATDNLSNLITNLAGQNNVASQSLQQLGVNTVDLSRNLGKRGLTGSLDVVLNAINRHGKAGLIVTSAFKQAATASKSLQTELNAMPPSLRKQAQAFDSGKESYKDFYAFAKSLGGQQYQMAKGFINTESQAKGFNNQLKSGNSTVRTLATTLQKSLGGVTGMRVALMLSGASASTFAADVKSVGEAAGETKGDVLGWAKTQDTLAVKMDKAKASLQVMAVEIGTALIPAVSKLADAGAKAAHWVDGLSGTQKKVLAWSVGTLAALGPVLSVGARLTLVGRGIGTFTTGAVSQLARFSTRLALNADAVALTMNRMTAALAGAGIGLAIGQLTQNSSNATKAVGALASAATGAAIGFGVGGPWGAAIGGGVGLLSNLAAGFLGAGHAAKTAIKPTDDFTNAIRQDNDAIGSNTRALVANTLQKQGLYDAGLKLGVSQKTLTDAMLGNRDAIAAVNDATLKGTYYDALAIKNHGHLTKAQQAASDAAAKLRNGMGDLNAVLNVNQRAARNIDAGMGKASSATKTLGSAADSTTGKVNGLIQAGSSLDRALTQLSKEHKVTVSIGDSLSRVQALANALASLHDRTVTVTTLKSGVGVGGRASGGGLPEGVSAVGERGAELAIKHGSHVQILSNAQSRSFLAATGMRAPGFASGTKPDQGTLSSRVSSAIGHVGAAAGAKFYVRDVGITRIAAQIRNAQKVLDEQIKKGLAAHTAATYRKEIASYIATANRQLANLRVKVRTSDLTAIKRGLKGTVDDTRAAFTTLFTDLKNIGEKRFVKPLQGVESRLLSTQNTLANARQYRSDVIGALRGQFDPTMYGSAKDLIAGLSSATSKNNTYTRDIANARKAGLNAGLLNTLAASGDTATLEALGSSSKSQIAQVNKAYSAYTSSLSAGGDAAEMAKYGKSIDDMSKQLAGFTTTVAKALGLLAKAANRPLELDGERLSRHTDKRVEAALRELEQLLK